MVGAVPTSATTAEVQQTSSTVAAMTGTNSSPHLVGRRSRGWWGLTVAPVVAGAAAVAAGGWIRSHRQLAQARQALAAERTDLLTGLPTRRAWVSTARAQVAHPEAVLWVGLADMDNLKILNDSWGHDAGHAALCAVAQRLTNTLPTPVFAGRLGGDEFGLIFTNPPVNALGTLESALCTPMTWNAQHRIPISVSVGTVAVPKNGSELGALLTEADRRMYHQKARHRAQHGPRHPASSAVQAPPPRRATV